MNRSKRIIKVSILGIIVNLILVLLKISIGIISNSITFVLDGINNLTDAFSSIVTILGTILANRKSDKEHSYGDASNNEVSFDLIVNFNVGREKIRTGILKKMKSQFPDYNFSCILDGDLSG